jgi:hypothetical protein
MNQISKGKKSTDLEFKLGTLFNQEKKLRKFIEQLFKAYYTIFIEFALLS